MPSRRTLPALAAVVLVPAALVAADAIETYDLDRIQVEQAVMTVYRGGWYPFDVTDALRTLPPEGRAAAVRALGEFTKGYVGSAAFKKEYAQAFKQTQPRRGIGLPSLDPKALARKAAGKAAGGNDAGDDRFALDKDPDVTLARRLREFLAATDSVDFAAPTTGVGRARRFVEERHEARPREWKMCFRAGREATQAARGFAEEWLAELDAAAAARKKK